jgi:hypothetical protein
VFGWTTTQIAGAKATGVEPTRKAAFAEMLGPDDAIVEYAGNYPAELFNRVHMFQEDPLRAEVWYAISAHADR